MLTLLEVFRDALNNKTVSRDQFTDLCFQVNPNNSSPIPLINSNGVQQTITYQQYIYLESIVAVKEIIDKIFRYMPYLDSTYVSKINKLNSSGLINQMALFSHRLDRNDFGAWADQMFSFIEILRELEDYLNTELRKYEK